MNYLVLDSETTNLEPKPFCYNLGYTIISPEGETLTNRDFVITQIWDNLPLFASAYYADKRPVYVKAMRARKAEKIKWGYAMQEMKRDIKKFNVSSCYAYNSPFDDKVIQFNCDWFHTQNAIETIPIFDIRGYAHHFICNDEYFAFCEQNQRFTDSGNYSTTAETMFQYITQNPDFIEDHTALSDSLIEAQILLKCIAAGASPAMEYEVIRTFPRITQTPFKVKVDGQIIYDGEYIRKYIRNNVYSFTTINKGR